MSSHFFQHTPHLARDEDAWEREMERRERALADLGLYEDRPLGYRPMTLTPGYDDPADWLILYCKATGLPATLDELERKGAVVDV